MRSGWRSGCPAVNAENTVDPIRKASFERVILKGVCIATVTLQHC